MPVKKSFPISVDLRMTKANPTSKLIIEGDTGNQFVITVTDNGAAVDLTGCRVMAIFANTNGTASQDSGTENNGITIGGAAHNVVTIDLFSESYARGYNECELQIYSGENSATLVTTSKFNFTADRSILNDDTIQSTDKFPILVQLIERVEALSNDVQPNWIEANTEAPSYIKNKPETFTPSPHKASHLSGADAITLADLGAAAAVHASRHGEGGADPVTPILHASRHAVGGADEVTPASIGAASATHAATHAAGGADPITPASIGAATTAQLQNRNLLDNWDFRNPVNQRGVSGTITTAGYFLDRWKLVSGSVTINAGSITLNGTMEQISEWELGTDVTASVKMQSGTATIAYDNDTETTTIASSGGVILSAKLEIGSVSTLASDPPVDFAAELSKCQRYLVALGGGSIYSRIGVGSLDRNNSAVIVVSLPTTMRIKPSLADITASHFALQISGNIFQISTMRTSYFGGCTVALDINLSATSSVGLAATLLTNTDNATIILSAEL